MCGVRTLKNLMSKNKSVTAVVSSEMVRRRAYIAHRHVKDWSFYVAVDAETRAELGRKPTHDAAIKSAIKKGYEITY